MRKQVKGEFAVKMQVTDKFTIESSHLLKAFSEYWESFEMRALQIR